MTMDLVFGIVIAVILVLAYGIYRGGRYEVEEMEARARRLRQEREDDESLDRVLRSREDLDKFDDETMRRADRAALRRRTKEDE